jgi:hypothetical protein
VKHYWIPIEDQQTWVIKSVKIDNNMLLKLRLIKLNKAIARVEEVMAMDFAMLSPEIKLQLVSEILLMARDFDVEGEIEFETLLDRLQDLKGKIKL